ncbi:mannose-1-phosphate guanylyltransferase [Gemmatimonadetes bacterium T265]|nr:mannose-1-phosphate guanylyltransferase [Gemmatimonadetes bacterium T265]
MRAGSARATLPFDPAEPETPGVGTTIGTDAAEDVEATADVLEPVGALPAEQLDEEAGLETELSLWAVVFAGGIGSRFWPLSSPERPKQLLALVGERPLIADTVARLAPTVPASQVLVVTSADIADALRAAIPEVPAANFLVEPRPLGTAAALAWGAQEVGRRAGPRTTFVAIHADLAVAYPAALRQLLARAARVTAAGPPFVVLGADPTRPETGFGYVLPAAPLDADVTGPDAPRRVSRFVEKPGPLLAEDLIGQGALWHTGILVARAGAVLEAAAELTPELQPGLAALEAGKFDRFAGMIQSISLERGLLERLGDLVVLPAACGWDDVGTWAALRRVRELDDTGNGVWGRAHLVDASGCVVHADGGTVVVYGVSGVLVVTRPGLTFVTTLDRATELRPLLDQLPDDVRRPGTSARVSP